MNRKSVVFAVVGCLVFLCALAACGTPATTDGKPLYPDNMNAKLALQLREDYVRFLEETSPGEMLMCDKVTPQYERRLSPLFRNLLR